MATLTINKRKGNIHIERSHKTLTAQNKLNNKSEVRTSHVGIVQKIGIQGNMCRLQVILLSSIVYKSHIRKFVFHNKLGLIRELDNFC